MSAGKKTMTHQNENIQKFISEYDHQNDDEEYISKKVGELHKIIKALILRELEGFEGLAIRVSNQLFRGYKSCSNYSKIEHIINTDLIDNITTIKRSFIDEYKNYDDFELNRAIESGVMDKDEESFYGAGYSEYLQNMTVLGHAKKVAVLTKPIDIDEFSILLN
jgi:hypothetical protein